MHSISAFQGYPGNAFFGKANTRARAFASVDSQTTKDTFITTSSRPQFGTAEAVETIPCQIESITLYPYVGSHSYPNEPPIDLNQQRMRNELLHHVLNQSVNLTVEGKPQNGTVLVSYTVQMAGNSTRTDRLILTLKVPGQADALRQALADPEQRVAMLRRLAQRSHSEPIIILEIPVSRR